MEISLFFVDGVFFWEKYINKGAKNYFQVFFWEEIILRDYPNEGGDAAKSSGSGKWAGHFHRLPSYFLKLSRKFRRITVLHSI